MSNHPKTKYLFIIVATILILFATASIISFKKTNFTFQNAYYIINLPKNWSAESKSNEVTLLRSGKSAAVITTEEDFLYGSTTESIVKNWIGMNAEIKSEVLLETAEHPMAFRKVTIGTSLSAAQEMKGEKPAPDEIHYFYLSGSGLFIDVFLQDESLAPEVEDILNALRLTKTEEESG